ncbi:MAG TPA: ATP synthase F0 subunit A, partial [Tenacibaculum sp.]|nr:ATP synthase F0 subunit A [Tenacibaculum sp.]
MHLGLEFRTPLSGKLDPFLAPSLLRLFIFIRAMNSFGLSPYTFTPTSRISTTVALAITVWFFIEVSYFLKALRAFLIHLVPSGTPGALIPLIVLIELVRNFIRPITLSVRLAANIVAGHLLIRLINSG